MFSSWFFLSSSSSLADLSWQEDTQSWVPEKGEIGEKVEKKNTDLWDFFVLFELEEA